MRQVIDGKLIQLGHEPCNTQVVVSKVDSRLYLVNDTGIVTKEMEHVSSDNVVPEALVTSHGTNELPNDVETLHKLLREVRLEIESLCIDLSNRNAALDDLHTELAAATHKLKSSR